MKLVFLISAFVVVGFAALTAADDTATPSELTCQKYETDVCTRELIPVCADGITYPNECTMCVESRNQNKIINVVTKGQCAETTTATAE